MVIFIFMVICSFCLYTCIDAAEKDERLVYGVIVRPREYPFAVVLLDERKYLACSASLISPDRVLTAAHCLTGRAYWAQAGTVNHRQKDTEHSELRKIVHYVIHPIAKAKRKKGDRYVTWDVGIIWVDTPFRLSPYINFIKISKTHFNVGDDATALGFGCFEGTKPGNIQWADGRLRKVNVKISDSCKNRYPKAICFRALQRACPGDSGGPIFNAKPPYNVYGVSAVIYGFGVPKTSGYASAVRWRDWLLSQKKPKDRSIKLTFYSTNCKKGTAKFAVSVAVTQAAIFCINSKLF